MKLSELFQRDNVPFPEWLPDDIIPDEWENAKYFKGEDSHKWELTILSELMVKLTYLKDTMRTIN